MLKLDRTAPANQWHTAKRIFERSRDEYGFAGTRSSTGSAVLAGLPMKQTPECSTKTGKPLYLAKSVIEQPSDHASRFISSLLSG
jgi:hypothetical protein